MSYEAMKQVEVEGESDDEVTVCDDSTSKLLGCHKKRPISKSWLSTSLQIYLAMAATTIIILGALNLVTLRSTLREQQILNAQHSNGLAETLPTTWGRDRRFMTLDHKYDHLWDEWKAESQIEVPGELPGEEWISASYSMFHQMHCLASMRKAIQMARDGKDPGFDYWDDGHWPHCFDYLRSAILCYADDTIEVAGVLDGKRQPFIDGSRVIRQCRSPEHIYMRIRFGEKKRAKENGEVDIDHEHNQSHHTEQHSHSKLKSKDDMLR